MTRLLNAGVLSFWSAWAALLIGLTGASAAGAQGAASGEMLDKASRQRMLTQRMVKAYCLVGMDVQSSRHRKQLAQATELFQRGLEELKAVDLGGEAAAALAEIDALWGPFREVVLADPDKNSAMALLDKEGPLLDASHKLIVVLDAQTDSDVARLVGIAGRQRTLSQRLAKFYMVWAWGLERPGMQDDMRRAAGEFEDALMTVLFNAESNTGEIQSALNEVRRQWRTYKRGLALESGQGEYIPAVMAATSENLLKVTDKIAGMYVALMDR